MLVFAACFCLLRANEAREGLCTPWKVIEDDAREPTSLKAYNMGEELERGNEESFVVSWSLRGIAIVVLARIDEVRMELVPQRRGILSVSRREDMLDDV